MVRRLQGRWPRNWATPFYGEEELFKAADEMGFLNDVKKIE